MVRRSLSIVVFLLLINAAFAQDSTQVERKLEILPLPVLFYTPETRLGFGGLGTGLFNLGSSQDTRISNVQVLAAYTINQQVIAQARNNIFTKGEGYNFFGQLSFFDFPIFYYGIGNDSQSENEEDLDYKVFVFEQRALKKVVDYNFVGIQYRLIHLYDLIYEPRFLLEDQARLEAEAGTYSGLGLAYLHDSRDNVLNSFKGSYLEFTATFHRRSLASDFNFTRYRLDARKYWLLETHTVLATQFLGEFNDGDVPFRELALMGGDQIMRGYYQGRFRDKNQVALQAEYRRQVIPWLGFVLFGSVGDVAASVDQFDLGDFKAAGGAGIRLMINKKDRVNIRFDYGLGRDTNGFYFAFAESF